MHRFVLFFPVLVLAVSIDAMAQAPNTLSYQGLLTTALGTPVPDGMYKLQFDLFTVSTGGVSFWTEVDSEIAVQRGTFSLILGNSTVLPDSFHRPLFIQITAVAGPGIGGPTTFTPRSALSSSPSSLSLKTPLTITDSVIYPNGVLTSRDKGTGFGLSGIDIGTVDYSAGTFGRSYTVNGNGVWGTAINGNVAYGTVGTSDSGYGAVGVAWYRHGVGVYAYNNALDGGTGVALATQGQLVVAGATGDSAVQLPDNSIDAHEILDEPGLTGNSNSGVFTYLTTGTLTAVDSVTISTPSTGYIVLEAGGYSGLSHVTGTTTNVYLLVDSQKTSAGNLPGYQPAYEDLSVPSGFYAIDFHCQNVLARSAGTYKFYLDALKVSGGGNCFVAYYWMKATYYPTSYGPVSASAPVAGKMEIEGITPALPSQGISTADVTTTDLRGLELRASKLREEAQRAENDVLKARLEKMKSLQAVSHNR